MIATAVLPIVIGVLIVLLIVLFVGGLIATGRRRDALRGHLDDDLAAADAALAQARAADRGWDRERIDAAAREALTARHAGREVRELHIVRVVDRPGTDEDEAVLRATFADGGEDTVHLGRRGDAWTPDQAG